MLVRIQSGGRIVIPSQIRQQLGLAVGDVLEVTVMSEEDKIELRRPARGKARSLAGSLKKYAKDRPFPSDHRIAEAVKRGLIRGVGPPMASSQDL
jgi:AbrB family looped-hinge helix DNA binding protein